MDKKITPQWDWYVTEYDVVHRLMYRHPHCRYHKPKVSVVGENGSFGKLTFNMNLDGMEIIEYNIYIKDKDRLIEVATNAISNYEAWVQYMDDQRKATSRYQGNKW